jgi:hypothetical protein
MVSSSNKLTSAFSVARVNSSSYVEAALQWYAFGFKVIPVIPDTKFPAVKWDDWLADVSPEEIRSYWAKHPDHALGFIVGDDIVVLDADSATSVEALSNLERVAGVNPSLVIKTRKGVHDYFRLASEAFAKSDSHFSMHHPSRIGVKTGRAMVILPPSPGKEIISCAANVANELTAVDQAFIDSIVLHNGRQAPRRRPVIVQPPDSPTPRKVAVLRALLAVLHPDKSYNRWLVGGAVLFNETTGGDEGLTLFNWWSQRGPKYKGFAEIVRKWGTYDLEHPCPARLATLCHFVAEEGYDPSGNCCGR